MGEGSGMTWAVYVDHEGYIGDVSAPDRKTAAAFLATQGYAPGTYELRELVDVIEEMEREIHPEG
jgi:hypothetical protein